MRGLVGHPVTRESINPCRKFRVISNSVWNVHELDRFRGSRRTSLMVVRGRNHVDASTSFTTSTLLPVQRCHKSSWPTSRRVPVTRANLLPTDEGENDASRRLPLSEVDHPEKPNAVARKSAFSRARGRNTIYARVKERLKSQRAY